MKSSAVESQIHRVTVFSSGALVVRKAEIESIADLEGGAVTLSGLPLSIEDRSIRTRVQSPGDGTPSVIDARVMLEFPGRNSDQNLSVPPELKDIIAREAACRAEIDQLNSEVGRLRKLQVIPRGVDKQSGRPVAIPHRSRASLVELASRLHRETTTRLRTTERDLEDIERERQEVEERISSRGSATAPELHELRKSVAVSLKGGSGAATLWLEYLVPGARWAPTYALRVDPATRDTELELRAVIAQESGEDWSDVELNLSTADPVVFSSLPELRSIRIGPRKPGPPQVGWRPAPSSNALYEAYDEATRSFDIHAPHLGSSIEGGIDALSALVKQEDLDDDDEPSFTNVYDDAVTVVAASYDEMAADEPTSVFAEEALAPKRSRSSTGMRMRNAPMPRAMAAPGGPPPALGGPQQAAVSVEPDALSPAEAFLDYGSLTMRAANESGRGTLQPIGARERYEDSVEGGELSVDEALGAVQHARHRAYRVSDRSLPSGCTSEWPDRFDHAYSADSPATIYSDGRFRSISIMRAKGSSTLLHVCVPRISSEVFRVAKMENPLGAPILPGPVDIYAGGDFVTTSDLDATPKDGKLEVGLGIEQSIKVARNTRYGEDSSGLLGGSRALRHEIHIELENLLSRAATIEVRERVPAVRESEEEIKISVGTVQPPWEPYEPFPDEPNADPLQGGYRWMVELSGSEHTELRAHYEIKISSKHELVGGNRREN